MNEYAGQDATRGFDEFGHSSDAKRILKKFLIGELVEVKIYITFALLLRATNCNLLK